MIQVITDLNKFQMRYELKLNWPKVLEGITRVIFSPAFLPELAVIRVTRTNSVRDSLYQ